MSAKNITNRHHGPLAIGGVTIGAGRTAAVPHWDQVKDNPTVKTWLDLKIISVEGDTPTPQAPEVVNDPDVTPSTKPLDEMTKAELVDYGKAKGMEIDTSDTKAEIFDQIKAAEAE